MSDRGVAPVPAGALLLHIGPHKTGTTSLQGALWNCREQLREQGVHRAGRTRNPSNAVRAVTGQPSPYSDDTPPPIGAWHALVNEVRKAREPRVVVSSEFFSWAKPDTIRRIIADLASRPVHVAVTLRPLARIIPSMWQQNVQAGQVATFDRWLRGVLKPPVGSGNAAFWMLQRHDELIRRWADVVGPEHVYAIVVDDRDHDRLLRVFEDLLALRSGTLAADPEYTNRSLTLPEAEAVRAFNIAFKAEGLPRAVHARFMRFGAAQEMKRRRPAPDEPRVVLPDWAIEPVAGIAREMADAIATSGVRIIGDLELLTVRPEPTAASGPESGELPIPPEIAASMAMGILVASGAAREGAAPTGPFRFAEPIEIRRYATSHLAGVIALRGGRTVGRAWARMRRIAGRLVSLG